MENIVPINRLSPCALKRLHSRCIFDSDNKALKKALKLKSHEIAIRNIIINLLDDGHTERSLCLSLDPPCTIS